MIIVFDHFSLLFHVFLTFFIHAFFQTPLQNWRSSLSIFKQIMQHPCAPVLISSASMHGLWSHFLYTLSFCLYIYIYMFLPSHDMKWTQFYILYYIMYFSHCWIKRSTEGSEASDGAFSMECTPLLILKF